MTNLELGRLRDAIDQWIEDSVGTDYDGEPMIVYRDQDYNNPMLELLEILRKFGFKVTPE